MEYKFSNYDLRSTNLWSTQQQVITSARSLIKRIFIGILCDNTPGIILDCIENDGVKFICTISRGVATGCHRTNQWVFSKYAIKNLSKKEYLYKLLLGFAKSTIKKFIDF